ncbi:MAG: DsrE/DsrF/TusD sulfur relay family protein [Candidatus Thorarchaeota archaeon]
MTAITVVIKSEPYSDESAYTGLKFALTALQDGHTIEIFLVQGGVFCALYRQDPVHMPNNYEMLESIIKSGGRVVCCGTCTKARGVQPESIHPNVEIGTMNMFVEMVASADRIVNF